MDIIGIDISKAKFDAALLLGATAFTQFACGSSRPLIRYGTSRSRGVMRRQGGELGQFGDARRAAMGSTLIERVMQTLIERVMQTGSLVLRKLGGDRAGEIAIHRFLSAASVTTGEMVETLASRAAAACVGRRIVAVQDTTEINFAGREERRRGLGPAGDGISAGFFIHPLIAVDSETDAVLGLLGARIWTRTDEIAAAPAGARTLQDKESVRWLEAAECAAARLEGRLGGGGGRSRGRYLRKLRATAGRSGSDCAGSAGPCPA